MNEDPEEHWNSMGLHDQIINVARAVAEESDLSEVLHAIEKPWNYKDEVFAYWLALQAERTTRA